LKLFLFLNELSKTPPASDIREARAQMERFVHLLARVRARVERAEPVLRTIGRIHGIEIGPGYPIARWQNDLEVDRELRKLLLSMSVQAELFPKDASDHQLSHVR